MDNSSSTNQNGKVKVFISYSSKDVDLMNELLVQLKVLTISDKNVDFWQDGYLEPGLKWDEEIKDKLHSAHIVLMLISAYFLTSDYVWNIEVQNTLERQEKNEVTAIPIILSPCAWMQTPIVQFQALPRKGRPITDFPDRNTALLEVVNGVYRVIRNWEQRLTSIG